MSNPITQADAGSSLSRIYDTVGQNSGGPQAELEADRILLVHEMGQVLFSERMVVRHRHIPSGAIAQSTNFAASITDLPLSPFRIIGITVASVDAGAVEADWASLVLTQSDQSATPREHILWAWRPAQGSLLSFRLAMGAAVTDWGVFVPDSNCRFDLNMPGIGGSDSASSDTARTLNLRGATAAFGAGTREVIASIALVLPLAAPGISSATGLPVPSW